MFFRKLMGSSDAKAEVRKGATPPGMQTMGANLQRKFAKGVQYNSKWLQSTLVQHGNCYAF